MCYVPDNYDIWQRHDDEQESALELLPVCEYCRKRIQDDYCYEVDGIICEECLIKHFRKDTTDLMG